MSEKKCKRDIEKFERPRNAERLRRCEIRDVRDPGCHLDDRKILREANGKLRFSVDRNVKNTE